MTDFGPDELAIVRRAYARQMLAIAGAADDATLEQAFASVERERFLGEPPWHASRGFAYQSLPRADPVLVYQDVLLALSRERGVNNGSPSLHAKWLHAARLRPGEHVVHIGAGAGYYSAIIAELVGPMGRVTAIESDAGLAAMATGRLSDRGNLGVVHGDGFAHPTEAVDCIYVNFAVERPVRRWTDQLRPGGRLIFPLGVGQPNRQGATGRHSAQGAAFLITRQAEGLAVQGLGPAWFVCAEGEARVPDSERESLRAAFEKGGAEFVRSLRWGRPRAGERVWHAGEDWCWSYDPPEAV